MSRKFLVMVLALAVALSCIGVSAMAEEEPVTISWYYVGGISDNLPRINEAASEYLQSKGINVNFQLVQLSWSDWSQRYQVMMTTGETFDLLNASGSTLVQYGINGGLIEITDEVLETKLPGVKAAASETLLNTLRSSDPDGKLYWVPVMHEWAQWYGFSEINMDIADALDLWDELEAVTCLDDMDPIFEKVHAAYPDVICLFTPDLETVMCTYKVDCANHSTSTCAAIDVYAENGVFTNYWENEGVVAVLRKASEWYKKGYINTDVTITESNLRTEGKIFCEIGRFKPGTGPQYSSANARYTDMAWDADLAPLLTMKDAPGGWGTAISKTTANADLAMAVLNAAYDDADFLNLLVFGQEGIDYNFNEDGYVVAVEGGYSAQMTSTLTWEVGNQPLNLVTSSYADLGLSDIWERLENFNNSCVAVESAGFFFDNTNVDIECAAIANVCDEYVKLLWRGAYEDLDATLAEFNQKLYDNGLQTVLDEINAQYQAFLANKAA